MARAAPNSAVTSSVRAWARLSWASNPVNRFVSYGRAMTPLAVRSISCAVSLRRSPDTRIAHSSTYPTPSERDSSGIGSPAALATETECRPLTLRLGTWDRWVMTSSVIPRAR